MGSKDIIPMDRWPPLLPMYMAEYESSPTQPIHTIEEIAKHFDITVEDIELFSQQPAFKSEVMALTIELKDSTSVIRQKAKAQLETYLDTVLPTWMVDSDFPAAEKVKTMKFLQELAETGGSTASKAKAKLEALPEQKTPSLNIFITPAGGEPVPVGGVTITQEPDTSKIIDIKKEEDKDGQA